MKIHGLTKGQWEIAQLVGDCVPMKEIASRRGVNVSTIYDYVDRIVKTWGLDPNLDAQSQIAKRMATLPQGESCHPVISP